MNKQKQLEILQKWISKQFIKRSFMVEEIVETKDPFTGNIITNVVQKRIKYMVPPSFKDGLNRVWYLTLPNNFTISYSEVKVKGYNAYTKTYVVNNLTKKMSEIRTFLLKKAYEYYGLDYEKVVNENL